MSRAQGHGLPNRRWKSPSRPVPRLPHERRLLPLLFLLESVLVAHCCPPLCSSASKVAGAAQTQQEERRMSSPNPISQGGSAVGDQGNCWRCTPPASWNVVCSSIAPHGDDEHQHCALQWGWGRHHHPVPSSLLSGWMPIRKVGNQGDGSNPHGIGPVWLLLTVWNVHKRPDLGAHREQLEKCLDATMVKVIRVIIN